MQSTPVMWEEIKQGEAAVHDWMFGTPEPAAEERPWAQIARELPPDGQHEPGIPSRGPDPMIPDWPPVMMPEYLQTF